MCTIRPTGLIGPTLVWFGLWGVVSLIKRTPITCLRSILVFGGHYAMAYFIHSTLAKPGSRWREYEGQSNPCQRQETPAATIASASMTSDDALRSAIPLLLGSHTRPHISRPGRSLLPAFLCYCRPRRLCRPLPCFWDISPLRASAAPSHIPAAHGEGFPNIHCIRSAIDAISLAGRSPHCAPGFPVNALFTQSARARAQADKTMDSLIAQFTSVTGAS